jgi:hypothetical protein
VTSELVAKAVGDRTRRSALNPIAGLAGFERKRDQFFSEQAENQCNGRDEYEKQQAQHKRIYNPVQKHAKSEPELVQGLQQAGGKIGSRNECDGKDDRPQARGFRSEKAWPEGDNGENNSKSQAEAFDAGRLALIMADNFFVSR